ncbi:choline/ethanolamine kinase [Mycolicibacterium madagascariense]|uniref:Choline/ethanolamine kinase n=1 Tax=Mycolicibacterium madagascariense TaxID=212765 RepID=A0A7I7XJZ0_9MYCO|nr:phosphotransferase [Mycolicibacterium madagascariense]MCV7010849.1 phosphotransferase [Mycolicibacterium madagascariense]BBZ29524.1 choline/ethanolamine kinase [Mycolicibacterium madagascariense]
MHPLSLDVAGLDELLGRLPTLAGLPRRLEDLPGGLTNRNVKVTTPKGVFVARCCDTTSNLLGIDREREYLNTKAAERAGVGAPVIDYAPELGILLLGYLEGKTLSDSDFGREGVIAKAAAAILALHRGPRFHGDFDMFERQPSYLDTVQRNGFRMPSDYLDHAEGFARIREVLGTGDRTTVPCHNDLLAGNFIEDGDTVRLIDYEYSGNNDPHFELGNVWSECGLTLDQLDELVTAYHGRRSRRAIARARLQGIVAKYGWTLWGCIQSASCALDFDFWGWAMERYDGAVAEFRGPDFDRLLADAATPD